jgi:Rrf2 family protein
MQISALEEYGLRCALQLAQLTSGETLAASQIAEREGISVRYASKILHLFRRSGLVASQRGIQGGFKLLKQPAEIPLSEVFAAVHGKPQKNVSAFCDQYKGLHQACVHIAGCSVRPIWQIIASYFDGVMDRISLADLMMTDDNARKKIEVFARAEADRLRSQLMHPEAALVQKGGI